MQYIIPKNNTPVGTVAKYAGLNNVRIIKASVNPYVIPNGVQKDEPIGISELGTPIYSDITFDACSYTDNNGRRIDVDEVNVQTVLITLDQPINIVKTVIQGRDGTVKEYIGKDDMQVTINGIITGKNGVYPLQKVNDLKAWLDAPISKGLTTWWLDNLGISNVVVSSFQFPQTEGGYSYQVFSISAISDTPVELKISTQ